ncbi:TetR family transcriptional regulator [Acetobacteraceae bacterium H6797]|nr:TetR family transcriptional regulator [Acetobacteraceae bacterium H6797]
MAKNPTSPALPRRGRSMTIRERILDAARLEFAEKGLAGARVDDIAARAEANKRLIYAYYGNKEALWLTVLETVYAAKRDEERALNVDALPPPEAMARLVAFNLRYTMAHPDYVALVNQENIHRASYLQRSERLRGLYTPLLDSLRSVLERGVAAGVFRQGVDPLQLYVTIVGLGHYYVANRHTLAAIFGPGMNDEAALAAREKHCIDVVLGYLQPFADPPRTAI